MASYHPFGKPPDLDFACGRETRTLELRFWGAPIYCYCRRGCTARAVIATALFGWWL